MKITLDPMLAFIGLSGGELILILIVLLIPVLAVMFGLAVFLLLRATKKNRPPAQSPIAPPVAQSTQVVRQCPKCGTILKSDVPEGLCPACLLQQAFATEGGVPPGTPPFTPPPLAELAKLFPQLEILETIGQGGMGAVYKARQPALDRFVALKILAPRSGGDVDFAGRFSREARALAKLSHPNIVAVYDYGQVQRSRRSEETESGQTTPPPHVSGNEPTDLNYFIMEFVDGPNLRQLEQAGKLSPREALQIIPQICAALQFAHDEGIVHRDIKPENVLLDKKGRVKIADFGLAKILGQDADFRLTGARDVMGTPHYMAPEQVEKPQEVDHRADIYSLGVVFYEMLTGELPLGKFDPPSHKVQIDVRLDDVVLRSLANNPDRRYQHVSEVRTELESIAGTPTPQTGTPRVNPTYQGVDYRSDATLFGLPLIHITSGIDPETGKVRTSKGIIAIGGRAQGVVAIGGFAVGGIAFGGAAIGLVAFGGGALGLFSFGGLAIALIFALGGGAIAPIALGGGALGYLAFGSCALGVHVLAANIQDPIAQQFFGNWGRACVVSFPIISTFIGMLAIGFGISATFWARRYGKSSNSNRIVDAIRSWLAVMDLGDYARSWELAAPYFQHAVKQEDWIGKGEHIRRPLGALHSRKLRQERVLAGGTQLQAKFDSSFEYLPTAVETVTFARQPNGDWKAIGYFIKPASGSLVRWLIWIPMTALFVGLFLVAGLIFWSRPSHRTAPNSDDVVITSINTPDNAPAAAEFHHQIFECDAATVDKLIPTDQRQTVADNHRPASHRTTVTRDGFKFTTAVGETAALFTMTDTNTLASLSKSLLSPRLLLVDNHQTVSSIWWKPGVLTSWASGRGEIIGNASWSGGTDGSGFLGVRHTQGRLEIRMDVTVDYDLSPEPIPLSPNSTLTSHLFYEGKAPEKGVIVFLVPFMRQDRSEHYLVVAYQITDLSTHEASSIGNSKSSTPDTIMPEEQAALIEIEGVKAKMGSNTISQIRPPTELTPAALQLAQQPPVVVETFPASGSRDVPAGETEIRVRFSKAMQAGSMSWSSAWENSTSEIIGTPHYLDDGRTCVLNAHLEPGRTYAWWLNSEKFHNFMDPAGQSAVPYLLIFQTKPN